MLKIRLQRFGKKHEPHFRVVLTDSRNSTKSGKFKEVLGWRNPRVHTHDLKRERIRHWLSRGARATGTVHNLLVSEGIVQGAKINVSPNRRGTNPGTGHSAEQVRNEREGEEKPAQIQSETKKEESTADTMEITTREAPKENAEGNVEAGEGLEAGREETVATETAKEKESKEEKPEQQDIGGELRTQEEPKRSGEGTEEKSGEPVDK